MRLRFFPVTSVPEAQTQAFKELRIGYPETLQFRLDDDDCLCADYIEVMRTNTAPLVAEPGPFAASLTGVMFSLRGERRPGVYDWPVAYFSAGAALRHPKRSIFQFGHYALPQKFRHVTLPRGMALATHDGTNDTRLPSEARRQRRGMTRMTPAEIRAARERYFPFLTETGARIAGLTAAMAE